MLSSLAFVHRDKISKMYFGEIKNDSGFIKYTALTPQYSEIIEWARKYNAKIVNLDYEELYREYLS